MPTIPSSTRFFLPGVVAIFYYPAIVAATRIPSSAEQAAATELTQEVDDISGWTTSVDWIETKDAKNRFRPQLPGAIKPESSNMTFNGSKNGTDVRGVLAQDQVGFIGFCDAGYVAGGTSKADIFPISVGNVAPLRSLDNAAFKIRIDFGITAQPARQVVLP